MDIQTLTNLFATTYDPNPNARKAGELEIRKVRLHRAHSEVISPYHSVPQIGGQEGMLTAVLHIIGNDNVEMYVRTQITRVERASFQITNT